MASEAQTPDGEAKADHLTGSDEEAEAAFAAISGAPEAPEQDNTEPEPADDAEEGEATEADEADPDAEPKAEELVEVEIGGKTYEVPPEVQKAILRQADYSRKMNEVGAKERALTERLAQAETLAEGAEKRAEALAEVRAIDARIKAYDGIDWAKAKAENPGEAAMAAIELLSLKDQRKEAAQAAANAARAVTEGRTKALEDARAEMDSVLSKELKGWGDELGTKITQYALGTKVALKTLQTLTDPAIVVALEKARQWDALQGAKTTIKAKAAQAPAVTKPGAPRRVDPKGDAMQRLRKEGTTEAAEAAFLSRMN